MLMLFAGLAASRAARRRRQLEEEERRLAERAGTSSGRAR
jgi:hypothetical protein